MNKRARGQQAEEAACRFLEAKGLTILERNYYIRGGELDIIASDGEMLVFVEVRSKTNTVFGTPEETISPQKQRFLYRAAEQYLLNKGLTEAVCRFDVVSVLFQDGQTKITWYEDAFRA